MAIVGLGTDIIECERIGRSIDQYGDTFLDRVYTPAERAYCVAFKSSTERFAARWAAKEAVLKCLGTGWSKGIAWHDVEVLREASGKPAIALGGPAREHAARLGIRAIFVSLSHTKTFATATAIAESADNPEDILRDIPMTTSQPSATHD